MSRHTWNLNVIDPDVRTVSDLSDAEARRAIFAIMRGEQPIVTAPSDREDEAQLVAA